MPALCISQGGRRRGLYVLPAPAKRRSEMLQGPGLRNGWCYLGLID